MMTQIGADFAGKIGENLRSSSEYLRPI